MLSEPIIGIDLGIIFSCIAIMRNGKVEIIDEKGRKNNLINDLL